MSGSTEPIESEEWVLLDFVARYVADVERRGEPRPLSVYLAAWPGAAAEVSREFERLEKERADERLRLGPYRLIRELGRGGQAVVHLAEDPRIGRKLALKEYALPPGLDPDAAAQRLRREAAAVARLRHPGICTLYEMGWEGDRLYLALQLIEGRPLTRPETPPEGEEIARVVRIIKEVAQALHVAHEAGLVHRDVKPANVMLTEDDAPVLLDFGVARDLGHDEVITLSGDVVGTPAYLAPEQVAGGRIPADRRCDVWALGVTLYELLAASRPFSEPTRAELYQSILARQPGPLRLRNPAVSRDLERCVHVALAKDPDLRYQSAEELDGDLRRVLEGVPVRARPPGVFERTSRWLQRHPRIALGLVAGIIVLSAFAVTTAWLLRRSDAAHAEALRSKEEAEESVERLRTLVTDQASTLRGLYFERWVPAGMRRRLAEDMLRLLTASAEEPQDPAHHLALAAVHLAMLDRGRDDAPLILAADALLETRGASLTPHQRMRCARLAGSAIQGLIKSGETERARSLLDLVEGRERDALESDASDRDTLRSLSLILESRAHLHREADDVPAWTRHLREALEIKRRLVRSAPDDGHRALSLREQGLIAGQLVSVLIVQGQETEAMALAEEADRAGRELVRISPVGRHWNDYGQFARQLGMMHLRGGRLETAIPALERGFEAGQIALDLSPDGRRFLIMLEFVAKQLSRAYERAGRKGDAERVRAMMLERRAVAPRADADALVAWGRFLLEKRGDPLAARLILRRAVERCRDRQATTLSLLARASAASGRTGEAAALAREALQDRESLDAEESRRLEAMLTPGR